jgi:hypothetical protein
MGVPSSGELKLWDMLWNQELGGSKGNNSLHSASVYAGFSTPDSLGEFYGYSDVEAPTVTTNALSNISYSTMRANGNVDTTGNENPTRAFYFGTSSTRTSNTKYTVGTGGAGSFQRTMTGLSQLQTYYCWAIAENSAGEAVGSRVQAQTTEQTYSATFATFAEGYAGIQSNVNYPAGYPYVHYSYQQAWVNPYSSNLNHIRSHTNTSSTDNHTSPAPGSTITINAYTRWQFQSQRSREMRFTAGGPVPSVGSWLMGPSNQAGQMTMQSTRSPGPVVISDTYGLNANAGGGNQNQENNTQFSWTFTMAPPRSYGPHSRQL